jgi:hypothetical protein
LIKSLKTTGMIFKKLSVSIMIILVSFIFLTCANNDSETLFVQKIQGNNLLIVDYSVWYGRDGQTSGRTLMKSVDDFNFRDIENLPLDYINEIEANKISSVKLKKPNSESKKQNEIEKINLSNLQIITKHYFKAYDTPNCMLNKYYFNSFTETKDSLILSGLKREYGNNYKNLDKIKIKKGNIKILSDSLNNVIRLEITDLNFIEESACLSTSYMIPLSEINEDKFSDFGFFKEVKK